MKQGMLRLIDAYVREIDLLAIVSPSSWPIVPSSPTGHSRNPVPLSSLVPNDFARVDLAHLPVEQLKSRL